MKTIRSTAVLFACLLIFEVALGYEERSYAKLANIFFSRVGEPTTVGFPNLSETAQLIAACKSGRTLLVESKPLSCNCGTGPVEYGRPEELTVTLRCPTRKGTPAPDVLVLVSDAAVTFDEQSLNQIQQLPESSAKPILKFLMSIDPGFRKNPKASLVSVYPFLVADKQHWLIHTETRTLEEAGCDQRQFQIVRRRGDVLELVGSLYDVEAIIKLKADGTVLLRTSNQCDGIQAALFDVAPKIGLRADFSGH